MGPWQGWRVVGGGGLWGGRVFTLGQCPAACVLMWGFKSTALCRLLCP